MATTHSHVRFARQILLVEVGESGQKAIGSAVAAVGGTGLAHEVAETYSLAAGFVGIREGEIDQEALAPTALLSHSAPRAVLAGSRACLAEIRRAMTAPAAPTAKERHP